MRTSDVLIIGRALGRVERTLDAWEESKHPRAANGQFGSGSGSGENSTKSAKWFEREENNRLGFDMPGYSRKEDIINTYKRAIERRNRLTSSAAGINNEIDRINRKRVITKEDEAKLKELKDKRVEAEHEDAEFRAELEKFKQKYGIKEEYGTGIGYKANPQTGEITKTTVKPLSGQAREKTVKVGNVSGK